MSRSSLKTLFRLFLQIKKKTIGLGGFSGGLGLGGGLGGPGAIAVIGGGGGGIAGKLLLLKFLS